MANRFLVLVLHEREIQPYVHSASLTYEVKSMFMFKSNGPVNQSANEKPEPKKQTCSKYSRMSRALAMDNRTISPMQHTPPPPRVVASTLQVQPTITQSTAALLLLPGKIIIKIDAIQPEAAAVVK